MLRYEKVLRDQIFSLNLFLSVSVTLDFQETNYATNPGRES